MLTVLDWENVLVKEPIGAAISTSETSVFYGVLVARLLMQRLVSIVVSELL